MASSTRWGRSRTGGRHLATQMHDRYTETPEYMALLRGASR
jgi:hypothetical protein